MLAKMIVKSEGKPEPKTLHNGKANGVAERVSLIPEGEDDFSTASLIGRRSFYLVDKIEAICEEVAA